ncbi:MAG: DUF736 domain-containing protein [Robiginitomaculum sp.]|nr:DUF736 domain-containing protein [Robiginitomaculum sp.]
MPTIGTFKPTKTGYEGTVATLSMTHKVKLITNNNKKNEDSPDFFIKSGRSDFGVAWKETKDGEEPLNYVKVLLGGPMLPKPVNAALFNHDNGADLVWSRPKKAQ